MARLIGDTPTNIAEKIVYDFIMKKLPDHVYAGFGLRIPLSNGRSYEFDFVLIIPHMGVFVMEIKGGQTISYENGELYLHYAETDYKHRLMLHQLKEYKYAVKNYLGDKFNVRPFVSEMLCLPMFSRNEGLINVMGAELNPDLIFFHEDFIDAQHFMSKLQKGMFRNELLYSRTLDYDDITDDAAHRIFYTWEKPITESYPQVLLISDPSDMRYASLIMADLQFRHIRVTFSTDKIPHCTACIILLSAALQDNPYIQKIFEKTKEANLKVLPLVIDDSTTNEYYHRELSHCQYRKMISPDYSTMCEIEKMIKEIAVSKLTGDDE